MISFFGDWMPQHGKANQVKGCEFSVGNLECAFSADVVVNSKAYSSVVDVGLLGEVVDSGFSALSVANNHAYDAGRMAFDQAVDEIERNGGCQIFGTVDKPYAVLRLNSSNSSDHWKQMIVIGCLESCRSRGPRIFKEEDVLGLIKRLKSSGPEGAAIVVYPHWGKEGEYTRYPSPHQRKLARRWIDAGADGVVGNHSHVPQGMEWYKGKPIYYSLGNYDFPVGEIIDYPESFERMWVSFDVGNWGEQFDSDKTRHGFEEACGILNDNWTLWNWAKHVGPINVAKNMSSWKIRLHKKMGIKAKMVTLVKFVVWQFLPKIILFRMASLMGR